MHAFILFCSVLLCRVRAVRVVGMHGRYAGIMAVHTRWHEGSLTSGHVAARMLGAEVAMNDPKTKNNW